MDQTPRLPLRVWGRIEALLPNGRCSVVMPNGYRTDAHPDKSVRRDPPVLVVGGSVFLEFSTYDLANPRMIRPDSSQSGGSVSG